MKFNGGLWEEGIFNDLCFEIQQYKKQLGINPNDKFNIVVDSENPFPIHSILLMNYEYVCERLNCGTIFSNIRNNLSNKKIEIVSLSEDKFVCLIQIVLEPN